MPTNNPPSFDPTVMQAFQRRSQEVGEQIESIDEREREATRTMMGKVEAVETAQRGLSAPVPPVNVDKAYSIKPADQRVIYIAEADNTVYLPGAQDVYMRRNILANAGTGTVTVPGNFVGANVNGSGRIKDVVLNPGEVLDYLAFFLPHAGGSAAAPENYRLNGNLVDAGTPGDYIILVVNIYQAKLAPEWIKSELQRIDALAKQANAKTVADFGLDKVNNTPDAQKPVSTAQAQAISQANAQALQAIRGGVAPEADTLAKLYNQFLVYKTVIGDIAPDADNVINNVGEMLAFFEQFPEGAKLVQLLASKADVSTVSALQAAATATANGQMLAVDKAKLDTVAREVRMTVSTVSIAGLNILTSGKLNGVNGVDVNVAWGVTLPNAPTVYPALRHPSGLSGNETVKGAPTANGCVIRVVNLEPVAASFFVDILAKY